MAYSRGGKLNWLYKEDPLTVSARKLWQKLQPDLWRSSGVSASHTTSKITKGVSIPNNVSGSTQKVG